MLAMAELSQMQLGAREVEAGKVGSSYFLLPPDSPARCVTPPLRVVQEDDLDPSPGPGG